MPELPEVSALAAFLGEHAVGRVVRRVDVAAPAALKTYDPPIGALAGLTVTGAGRHGKFLDLSLSATAEPAAEPAVHLVVHLARGGWLHWRDHLPDTPPRLGRGPLAVRVRLAGNGPGTAGFDLTEHGTQKKLAVYLVRDARQVPGVARLGIDALDPDLTVDRLADLLRGQRGQIKGVLTDQTVLAGVGNAYSDEILHAARLSPFAIAGRLTGDQVARLHAALGDVLTDAVDRSIGQRAATLKAEKRSGLAVHARTGLPCPVCGDTVREVSFAERSLQYCPTCQTGGRPLADRRLSRLLR
ncbi:MAG TPA: DNA-formamidopyrimidine glycosylase family protein [Mycobacteriales bacterium]|nr:DNA-formamidopyrimidine glycosylase family protein [Mycobacteriales bacterium]